MRKEKYTANNRAETLWYWGAYWWGKLSRVFPRPIRHKSWQRREFFYFQYRRRERINSELWVSQILFCTKTKTSYVEKWWNGEFAAFVWMHKRKSRGKTKRKMKYVERYTTEHHPDTTNYTSRYFHRHTHLISTHRLWLPGFDYKDWDPSGSHPNDSRVNRIEIHEADDQEERETMRRDVWRVTIF